MATPVHLGNNPYRRDGLTLQYRCDCDNGSVGGYTNTPSNCASLCGESSAAGVSIPRLRDFRNMEGKKFSAKNFLIFAAIGAAAFFAYKKFVK